MVPAAPRPAPRRPRPPPMAMAMAWLDLARVRIHSRRRLAPAGLAAVQASSHDVVVHALAISLILSLAACTPPRGPD